MRTAALLLLSLSACAGSRAADADALSVRSSLRTYALTHVVLSDCNAGHVDDQRYAAHEDQVRSLLERDPADCETADRIAALVSSDG